MSEEERRRRIMRQLLQMALDGRITVKNAGELMGESCRHAKGLRRRYDLDGARGRSAWQQGEVSTKCLSPVSRPLVPFTL
ncbi:MAG: hypothetical protein DRG37_06295 [Deltaproteobacteria bacterium]|nr:MAG: hypothetical protein DRG37_06295 [Deltaproteobacteria bacterium]